MNVTVSADFAMRLSQRAAGEDVKRAVLEMLPAERYLLGDAVLSMPAELSGRRISREVLDAHSRDVTGTLDAVASSTKRLSASGLPVARILLSADKIAREVIGDAGL